MAKVESKRGTFQFAIDRGGTFTDVWARCPNGKVRLLKLLSEDPLNYPDAPREAIRRIIQDETGKPCPSSEPLDTSQVEWIRMGTTVATNALLERKGERTALVITQGFRDLLYIGNQARPNIFDLCQPDMDSQGPKCITEVAGFELVCLNPFLLETAYLQFRQEHDVDLDTTQAE
ncbi:hypothetical protein ACOMHN_034491 [Nucella lapillus]